MKHKPTHYFIFDVESVGLHGEGFSVAGGIYREAPSHEGKLYGDRLHRIDHFAFHCDPANAQGTDSDREWIAANVTTHPRSVERDTPKEVRDLFWNVWMRYKNQLSAVMFVECGWPVEAKFLEACISDDPDTRNWDGPYPMHEVASIMLAAGMDPMASYERRPDESPAHEPLADSHLSARLLGEALNILSPV